MNKVPIIPDKKLLEAVKKFDTPFYIYDEKSIRQNIKRLQKAFSWNAGYKEYFAVKAAPTPGLLKIVIDEGCGLDCSSYTELMLAEAVGAFGNNIMFSSNQTPDYEYAYASKLNAKINLDDYTHIDFLDKTAGLPVEVCCRYNPGNVFPISTNIMDKPEEAKYGFTYPQLVQGYIDLKNKGVKSFGMHAFLASNSLSDEYYPYLSECLFSTAVKLKREHGITISYINLSGGIGIPYLPEEPCVNIELIGQRVKEVFNRILVPENLGSISIFTELGRYITGPYGYLISKVLHFKDTYKHYAGIDACAANLMRPAMYGSYHHISVIGKENKPKNVVYDVVGSLCENNDKFAVNRPLPKLNVNDILVIHDAGAHGHAMGYNYNGKLRSAEILLREDGSFELMRRKETPKDYFATLDFLKLDLS